MDIRKMGCEEGRWMEIAQDRVHWRPLVLAMLNLRVLPPQCYPLAKYIVLLDSVHRLDVIKTTTFRKLVRHHVNGGQKPNLLGPLVELVSNLMTETKLTPETAWF
jgi:hypothetical protein